MKFLPVFVSILPFLSAHKVSDGKNEHHAKKETIHAATKQVKETTKGRESKHPTFKTKSGKEIHFGQGAHSFAELFNLTATSRYSEDVTTDTDAEDHHRSLYPDNYVSLSAYWDSECAGWPTNQVYNLLNECIQDDPKTSYILKTNRKQNTLVELHWKNAECKGVPETVYDLFKDIGVTEYSSCQDNMKWEYLNQVPSQGPGMVTYYAEPGYCPSNPYFIEWFASNTCVNGVYYDTYSCVSGYVTKYAYNMLDCTGDYWSEVRYPISCQLEGWSEDGKNFEHYYGEYCVN